MVPTCEQGLCAKLLSRPHNATCSGTRPPSSWLCCGDIRQWYDCVGITHKAINLAPSTSQTNNWVQQDKVCWAGQCSGLGPRLVTRTIKKNFYKCFKTNSLVYLLCLPYPEKRHKWFLKFLDFLVLLKSLADI